MFSPCGRAAACGSEALARATTTTSKSDNGDDPPAALANTYDATSIQMQGDQQQAKLVMGFVALVGVRTTAK